VQKQSLKADIEQHDSEVKRLAKEITDHESDIKGYKADQAAATKDRKAARATYEATHQDYSESIDAISNAVGVLKKRGGDIPQAAALLQTVKSYKTWPVQSKNMLENFLSVGEDSKDTLAAPEANAYESQSGGIVQMLLELKDKFVDERTALEKKEMVSVQAYDTVMMDLGNSVKAAENEVSKKTRSKSENIAASGDSSTLFDETKASRDDDQEYLTGLIATCQQKSADFKTRVTMREEEISALEKAMEIIGGDAVSAADKHSPRSSMLQVRSGVSLVQFLSSSREPNKQKAIEFLEAKSRVLDSSLLSALAMQMTGDPFNKVKKLISDLITKLKNQEAEEAGHKQWCDDELKTNTQTRKDKTTEVDGLTAYIEQLESRLAVLKKDLATLAQGVAEINAAVAKATNIRASEKDQNEATIVKQSKGKLPLQRQSRSSPTSTRRPVRTRPWCRRMRRSLQFSTKPSRGSRSKAAT